MSKRRPCKHTTLRAASDHYVCVHCGKKDYFSSKQPPRMVGLVSLEYLRGEREVNYPDPLEFIDQQRRMENKQKKEGRFR